MKENWKLKSLRYMKINDLLVAKKYPSAKKLAEMFEVSERTIKRDIEFLRNNFNATIEYDKKKRGYYYTEKSFTISSIPINEGELFVIATILPLMKQYKNTPLKSSYEKICHELMKLFPDSVVVNTGFLNEDILFIADPLPKIDEKIFNGIFKALELKKIIKFDYKNLKSQEYKRRTFECYKILYHKGNWYVIGFDHEKKEKRNFALSRIRNIKITDNDYELPKDFDIKKIIDLDTGVWIKNEPPTEYELLFDSKIGGYVFERKWHNDQEIKCNTDGTVYLKFKSNQTEEIQNWILSFGTNVTVLKPEKLRKFVKETAMKLVERYE